MGHIAMFASSCRWLIAWQLVGAPAVFAADVPVARPKPAPPRVDARVALPTKNEQGQYQREVRQLGHRLLLNLASQVLHLDIPKQDTWRGPNEKIRPGDTVAVAKRGAALMSGKATVARLAAEQLLPVREVKDGWFATSVVERGQTKSGWVQLSSVRFHLEAVPVQPTLSDLPRGEFTSAAALAQKAKQFDDGLYAAVELAAQKGLGTFSGKQKLLLALTARFAEHKPGPEDQAIITVLAAASLGDPQAVAPPPYAAAVRRTIDGFRADPLRSKPIGFYTWSGELRNIFSQDRMLQTPLESQPGIQALAEALRADAESRDTYEKYLTLVSRLTNLLVYPDLRTVIAPGSDSPKIPAGGLYFFPPSRAHETELVKKLFANTPIPADFNLADELVKRIKAGEIQLAPHADSGWYDYQTWSLEPLVVPESTPEAARLSLAPSYRDHLRDLFKGVLALARETHIKQLEVPAPAAAAEDPPETRPEFFVGPELSVEPLVESYRRRAVSYRFVRDVIETAFGREALASMHRLTALGPVETNLADELRAMEGLFAGAAVTAARQLGLDVDVADLGSGVGADADAQRF